MLGGSRASNSQFKLTQTRRAEVDDFAAGLDLAASGNADTRAGPVALQASCAEGLTRWRLAPR